MGNLPALLPNATPLLRRFCGELSKERQSLQTLPVYTYIQGVSEFDRQTFRVDSTIKNKHKTLNTSGVKNS
jgi:hypothetical protein